MVQIRRARVRKLLLKEGLNFLERFFCVIWLEVYGDETARNEVTLNFIRAMVTYILSEERTLPQRKTTPEFQYFYFQTVKPI